MERFVDLWYQLSSSVLCQRNSWKLLAVLQSLSMILPPHLWWGGEETFLPPYSKTYSCLTALKSHTVHSTVSNEQMRGVSTNCSTYKQWNSTYNVFWSLCTACPLWPPHKERLDQETSVLRVSVWQKRQMNNSWHSDLIPKPVVHFLSFSQTRCSRVMIMAIKSIWTNSHQSKCACFMTSVEMIILC